MDIINYMTNLNAIVGPNIVLINGLEPANIVMGMSNEMNIQFAWHNACSSIVFDANYGAA